MQFADSIQEANTRIEEAAAVFRFKARQISGEFDDLSGRWSDARARQFEQQQLQVQREMMEEGERLCRQTAELCETAKRGAYDAESQLSAFFSLQSEYEASTTEALGALAETDKLTERVNGETAPMSNEARTIDGEVEDTGRDAGWKPRPAYDGPAKHYHRDTRSRRR